MSLRRSTGLAVTALLIALAATPGAVARANLSSGRISSSLSESDDLVDLTNLRLVEGLNDRQACLFRNGVYPAGEVGYADSSLPYDAFPDVDAALATYRAELIRAHAERLGGVTIESRPDGTHVLSVSFVDTVDLSAAARVLDGLSTDVPAFSAAVARLHDAGITPAVTSEAASNILTACRAQEAVTGEGGVASQLAPAAIFSSRDEITGQFPAAGGRRGTTRPPPGGGRGRSVPRADPARADAGTGLTVRIKG